MNKLRKFLVIGVMVMTVFTTMGMVAPRVEAAASAGDLIKMSGLSSVYYLGADGKRYVFPNTDTYMSWYSDFSGVVTIPASELQSYPLGGNVVMRPGTKLVKITTDPTVYAVEPNGVLRSIVSEANATALFGTNWNKRVVDVPDAFFTNYKISSPLTVGQVPVGSLVKTAASADVYYYDGTNYRMVASEAAFHANRFQFGNVLTVSNAITAGGTAIATAEFVNVAQGGTPAGPVVTGSGLMVSLNAATPAAMNIPGNSSVEFARINMTAANDGPVNVSSIVLTATGLSNATNIKDVTFYDNGVKIGSSRNINSDRVATFNFATPIHIAAGSTKTLVVKATISDNTGTYGLGIAKAADIISSGATVSGSFPVNGNMMSAMQANLGSLTVVSPVDLISDVNFGDDHVLLADFNLRAGNDEDAILQSIAFYNGGTNVNGIVDNLKLFIEGKEVASGVYVNRYATFNLNNYVIKKGDTVSLELRGDIGTTSQNDDVKFYIKENNDIVAVGKTHGFGLTITTKGFDLAISTITLKTGDVSLDMDKTATPAKDIKADTKNVVLATVKVTSNGENATLSNINGTGFYVTTVSTTTELLENVRLIDKSNRGTYDLKLDVSGNQHRLSLSEDIALMKGVTKTFEVVADVKSIVPEGTTFAVTLNGSAMTIEGDVSKAKISRVTPSSVTSSIITVKAASLTVSPTALINTNVVGGTKDVVVYQAKVKAGTADSVRIQSLRLTSATSTATTATSSAFTDNNITRLSLWLDGKPLREVSNQISGDSPSTNGTVTFSSLNTANNTIPSGREYDLVVKADFSANITPGSFRLKVSAAGDMSVRSVVGNNVVTPILASEDFSRVVVSAESGTLTVGLHTTDAKSNKDSFLLAGSQTEANRYLGEIRFATANEAIKVKTLTLNQGLSATNADLSEVKLVKADGTVVASKTVSANGSVVFDPFDVVFEADKTTSLYIVAVAKGMNVNGNPASTANAGRTVRYTLGAVTASGEASGATISATNQFGTSKTATIVGSKLNSISNNLADGKLSNGNGRTIAKYTFVFENGSNREANNDEMKAVLAGLTMNFAKDVSTTLANVRIAIDGTTNYANASTDTATSTILAAAATDGVAVWETLSGLLDSAKMDGSVTLVVTANVSGVAERSWLESTLNVSTGNILYSSQGVSHDAVGKLPHTEIKGAHLKD